MFLLTLQNAHLRIQIAPGAGASIVTCEANVGGQWMQLMRPTPPDVVAAGNSSLMASFILAPWSNRIRDARFQFNGTTYQLRANTREGYAHHGDVRQRPWNVTSAADDAVTLVFASHDFADINFPFPFTVTARYSVSGTVFNSELALTNTGQTPMPAGLGFHPHFNRALVTGEDVEIQFQASGVYPELVPSEEAGPMEGWQNFSRLRALGPFSFDHCFAGWNGHATLHWPRSSVVLGLDASRVLSHAVLYAPANQPFFAFEPVSHANNGFNLLAAGHAETGVAVLKPGQALQAAFRVECESGSGE